MERDEPGSRLSGTSAGERNRSAPALEGDQPYELEEYGWSVRYTDPDALTSLLPDLPESRRRRVLEAFVAWREQRLDDALVLLNAASAASMPDPLWASRAHAVVSGVLTHLGLVREAFEERQAELKAARESGDRVAVAAAVHNLGVAYLPADPERAQRQYLEGLRLALEEDESPAGVRCQLDSIVGLAVVNLHDIAHKHPQLPVPERVPTPQEARQRVDGCWPDMAAVLAALVAEQAIDDGRLDDARRVVDTLPAAESVRDIVNSVFVARIQARLLALEGRPSDAVALLEAEADRLPPQHVLEVVEDIVAIHEGDGDLAAALAACRRHVAVMRLVHEQRDRSSLRALAVWYRNDQAEEEVARARQEADVARAQVAAASQALEVLQEGIRRDALTGLWNRRHLLSVGHPLLATPGPQLAVADLDRFKQVNDRLGHVAGDDALRAVAEALRSATRPGDIVARYGGDEFVVVRPEHVDGSLAEDLEPVAVLHAELAGAVEPTAVTTSIGVAASDGTGWEHTLSEADRAMYDAKRAGGGCVRTRPATSEPAG